MSSPTRSYKGILNSGNWCYLNSILQTLASIPSFVKCLEDVCGETALTSSLLFCNVLLRCLKGKLKCPKSGHSKLYLLLVFILQCANNLPYTLIVELRLAPGCASAPTVPFDPTQLIGLIARAKPQFCSRDEQVRFTC
jgi:uncharacterized UBP type Zn finger protein